MDASDNAGRCGGCNGLGAHKRWCITTVGPVASKLGPCSESMEEWGDRVGGVDGDTANMLYSIANVLEGRAAAARQKFQQERE